MANELSTAQNFPQGFGTIAAEDLMMPRVKVYHPLAKTEVPGAKVTDFYEVNSAQILGNKIEFALLGQKTVEFENENDDGELVKKYNKNVLAMLLTSTDVPTELVLSSANIMPFKKLLTTLVLKSKEAGGAPAFAFKVSSVLKAVDGKKGGKYGVVDFTVDGLLEGELFDKASILYTKYGTAYGAAVVSTDEAFAQ